MKDTMKEVKVGIQGEKIRILFYCTQRKILDQNIREDVEMDGNGVKEQIANKQKKNRVEDQISLQILQKEKEDLGIFNNMGQLITSKRILLSLTVQMKILRYLVINFWIKFKQKLR